MLINLVEMDGNGEIKKDLVLTNTIEILKLQGNYKSFMGNVISNIIDKIVAVNNNKK